MADHKKKTRTKPGPKTNDPVIDIACRGKYEKQCGDYGGCLGVGDFKAGIKRWRKTGGKCYCLPKPKEYGLVAVNPANVYA
jgi:hypothetical protein